jgi:hypothetical protein
VIQKSGAANVRTAIALSVAQGSTPQITCGFVDQDGAAVTPTTVTLTLRDADGEIINGRDHVDITSSVTAGTLTFRLSPDDTAVPDGARLLEITATVEWTWPGGSGRHEIVFRVDAIS